MSGISPGSSACWFDHYFQGAPEPEETVDESFHVDPSMSVSDVIDDYRRACANSREVVEQAPSLEVHIPEPHWRFGDMTLRWVLLHMIRETARHAGHLDILRELTDGQTGDH